MSTASWVPSQGQLINKRYELLGQIGRGGMGVVHAGFDIKLERPVALKFLDPDFVGNAEALGRFELEALSAGRVDHENICDIRDMGTTTNGVPYIVMELLEGQPLSRLLSNESVLPPRLAVEISMQILGALDAAHDAGIVHRDLKPENVFLTTGAGGRLRVKIVDFGISKFMGEGGDLRLTKTGVVMGSPYYMSPEQARGCEDIDQRSDLWSVGVILFEALTGRLPFVGANYNDVMVKILTESPPRIREYRPGLSEGLDAVVYHALSRQRSDRFSMAQEFAAALEVIVVQCPTELVPPSTTPVAAVSRSGDNDVLLLTDVDSKAFALSPPTDMPRRTALYVVGGVILLGVVTGLVVAFLGTTAPDRSDRGPEDDRGQTASHKMARAASTKTVASAPDLVRIKLLRLPQGAAVTFDGEAVAGHEIVGRKGHKGILVVTLADANPMQMPLVLEEGLEIDVGLFYKILIFEEGLDLEDEPTQEPALAKQIRSAKRVRPPSGTDGEEPQRPDDRFQKGAGGSKIKVNYGDH